MVDNTRKKKKKERNNGNVYSLWLSARALKTLTVTRRVIVFLFYFILFFHWKRVYSACQLLLFYCRFFSEENNGPPVYASEFSVLAWG